MSQPSDLEQLVRELNDPSNQAVPDAIDSIQRRIQRLQRESQAWQWGIDLLNHNEAVMRFYGALTLTIKINADWDTDKVGEDRNLVNHLLENLVSSYVRLASIPDAPFVLQKLCTTLVAVFQKPQSAWALPIRHLTACTVANRYIPQEAAPELQASLASRTSISGAQLRSLLLFPTTLAEQDVAISGSVKEQGMRVRVSNNASDVLRLSHFAATSFGRHENGGRTESIYALTVEYNNSQFLDMARTMLQLVPVWISDIKVNRSRHESEEISSNFDLFRATVQVLLYLLQQEVLASSVLQAFTALEESSHRLLQAALPGYERHIIDSQQATSWIDQLVSGDFDADAMVYVNFLEACMSQVDVTSPHYLSSGSYIELLKQVRTLLHCEGVAGVDDTVCQVALEILTSVTEGFSDWDEPSPYDDSMRQLISDACSSVLNKIRIPHEELSTRTQTWDADDRAKFQDFRYDVQDYLQNAFGILGEGLIEEITKTIIETSSPSDWDLFEAGLFCIVAFSDTLANEAERFDKCLSAIFDCEKWRITINAEIDVPDRVRQMTIKVIGENTGFLQRHTGFLVPSLNFLFTSLHMASSATAASRAIYTLCDAQRSMLTEALPQFLLSLNTTSDIELDAKHRIYAAVGALIQALPSEETKVQPSNQVIRHLLETQVENRITSDMTYEEVLSRAIDVLQTLGSFGRGLRAPSDAPIDLEKSEETRNHFWFDGPGAMIQQQLLHIHNVLLQNTQGQNNAPFIEASCGFLRAGFTEDHPSPFKFPNSKIIELLSPYIQPNCPQPDHVMSTASSYLASVQPSDPDNEFRNLWLTSIHAVNAVFVTHRTTNQPLNTDYCTATLDFSIRLLPKWTPTLFLLPEAQDSTNLLIEIALLLIEDSDTLPRRTSASFFTALFEASSQLKQHHSQSSNPNTTISYTAMETIIQTTTPRILSSVIRLLGGVCARSDIDILAETIKKAVQRQPQLTNRILREAVRDENVVLRPKALQATKPEQRARFVAQVEMLKGARKTNEVIREFWIACKGKEFEYVT